MQTEFSDLTENVEDNLLSEVTDNLEDDIPSAQVQRQKPKTSHEHETKQPKEKPSTSSHQQNDMGRKRHREDKSAKTSTSNGAERSRQEEELIMNSIQEKIKSSNGSIGCLKNHLEKGTCPKTLRYTARANIMPDEDFQNEIGSIRKKAEQALVGALVRDYGHFVPWSLRSNHFVPSKSHFVPPNSHFVPKDSHFVPKLN